MKSLKSIQRDLIILETIFGRWRWRGDDGVGGHGDDNMMMEMKVVAGRKAHLLEDKQILTQRSSKVLNEEELEFLADLGVPEGPVTQTVITHNATYQADDLDAYDSDCDDFSTAKAILMANLSSYGSDVLSEIASILQLVSRSMK
ncbi:hypothetical protein Tco_0646175 [Tanacetum coccineum]